MKTIHFFGCSFTAGHELPDDDVIPWKKDCKTSEEFYAKFADIKYALSIPIWEYVIRCHSMAYPRIIESTHSDWKCINHAQLGSSIRQEIFKIVTLIENSKEPVDLIVFQIPSFTREFALTDEEKLESVSMNGIVTKKPKFNEYLEKSVIFHSINHWTFQAQLDLLMFEGYLLSKNIKFMFIELDNVNSYIKGLCGKWKLRYPEIFSLEKHIDLPEYRLLGLHFNQQAHNIIADILGNKIKEII